MITDYKERLQKKLTDSMVNQRNLINYHVKEIAIKKSEVSEILEGVNEVEEELEQIKENEQIFLK